MLLGWRAPAFNSAPILPMQTSYTTVPVQTATPAYS